METFLAGKLKRNKNRHAPEISLQTGFPSAATHYRESSIDLHNELITNQDATFFVRIVGNLWEHFNIKDQDVLIIDRSFELKENCLAVIVENGEFSIIRFSKEGTKAECILWGVITYIIHHAL